MKLRTKSQILVITATVSIALLSTVGMYFVLDSIFMSDTRHQNKMAAELIRVTLTHEMDKGSPDHIAPYLNELRDVPGLRHVHLVPADSVIKEHQIDMSNREAGSALEKQVMTTGKSLDEFSAGDTPILHFAVPYLAQKNNESNCLQCHAAQEGDVLGVVSIELDVSEQQNAMNLAASGMLILFAIFGLLLSTALRQLLSPVIRATRELKAVVDGAESGDFSKRLVKQSDDEMGDIVDQTNRLMVKLEGSLGGIAKEVESLVGVEMGSKDANILDRSMRVVHNLVGATRFKQIIENDRDLSEVYQRISLILTNEFEIKSYSLYEVSNSKNRLQLEAVDGLPESATLWCSREVTLDCQACRARRTASQVSSVEEDGICRSFSGNIVQSDELLKHICLPIMLSGGVGGVLQLVFNEQDAERIVSRVSMLTAYLNEAAPVIETKRLMLSLKEASLRDPMTNLYNRRFLESYLDTLESSLARDKRGLGILMCDVDFFKQVNDTLGHEVGDAVLIRVSEILKQSVRSSDLVIRYGGEEFLALLIGADEEKTLEVAERVRKSMEDNIFQTSSGQLKKTLSIGVSLFPDDVDAFWECVKFADIALYEAKESGRNKVLRFTKEMWKDE